MQNEKELRAQAQQQAQQQIQEFLQKKQQELGRELTNDDLEKIAGGESLSELSSMYFDYHVNCLFSGNQPLPFMDWVNANGFTITF